MDDYYTEMKAATIAAMQEADALGQTDGVNQRGGKKYLEVKHRTSVFRRHFGTRMGIETSIIHIDDAMVRVQAIVRDQAAMIVGSGIAEERRGSSNVNTTSAVENCETSAIGRALASIGLHGGEYASANEIDTAQRNSIGCRNDLTKSNITTASRSCMVFCKTTSCSSNNCEQLTIA